MALEVDDLGTPELKNIAAKIQVFRVRLGTAERPALPLPDKPSIAVLPFQNMSGDPEQEYFADGMVEDIITASRRIRWLFVIARNSSFTYKGQAIDVKRVGRELGVRYVLEGSVRKGWQVRVTAQLIDAAERCAPMGRPLRWLARRCLRPSGQGSIERLRRNRAGITGRRNPPCGRPSDKRSHRIRPILAGPSRSPYHRTSKSLRRSIFWSGRSSVIHITDPHSAGLPSAMHDFVSTIGANIRRRTAGRVSISRGEPWK